MTSAPTWLIDSRIVAGSPLESTNPSEMAQPSAATSQLVSSWVSISIPVTPVSLYSIEYIVTAASVQPSLGRGDVVAYVIYDKIQRGRERPVDRERKPMSDYNLLIDAK